MTLVMFGQGRISLEQILAESASNRFLPNRKQFSRTCGRRNQGQRRLWRARRAEQARRSQQSLLAFPFAISSDPLGKLLASTRLTRGLDFSCPVAPQPAQLVSGEKQHRMPDCVVKPPLRLLDCAIIVGCVDRSFCNSCSAFFLRKHRVCQLCLEHKSPSTQRCNSTRLPSHQQHLLSPSV